MLPGNDTHRDGVVNDTNLVSELTPFRTWSDLPEDGGSKSHQLRADGSLFHSQARYAFTVAARNIEFEGE